MLNIIMRSKRKEVNKYSHKQSDDLKEGQSEQQLRRNAGVKPFQLTKLRLTHRHVNEAPLPSNELLHRRTGSNHFFNDLNEINLDLVIKQKLIIDAQFNQKLESERKNLIYLAQDNYDKCSPPTEFLEAIALQRDQSAKVELIEDGVLNSVKQKGDFVAFSQQKQMETQQMQAQAERRRQASESFQKHHIFREMKASEEECEDPSHVAGNEEPGNSQNLQDITKMEIKLLKQKTYPPFSFTSAKWRSKSENLQIDKWKQKYSREAPALIKQIEKQILNERHKRSQIRSNQATEQKNPIHSQEKQKVSLPSLQKMKDIDQTHSKVKLATKKSHQKEGKSLFRIQSHPEMKTHRSLQLIPQKQAEPRSKRAQQESIEEKVEIIIKKMYESELEKYQETTVSEADCVQNTEQQEGSDPAEGRRKKKSKFPEIQISTFTSTKELEAQKKKEKLQQIQRLAKQWRYVAPRKTYVSKVMEQIPERWQYGESRESSRQQVDDYLLVEQLERREYEKVKSQQLEEQSGESNSREGFLFLESRLTND